MLASAQAFDHARNGDGNAVDFRRIGFGNNRDAQRAVDDMAGVAVPIGGVAGISHVVQGVSGAHAVQGGQHGQAPDPGVEDADGGGVVGRGRAHGRPAVYLLGRQGLPVGPRLGEAGVSALK